MITCEECRAKLVTEELLTSLSTPTREHCATCAECDAARRHLLSATRGIAESLQAVRSAETPQSVAYVARQLGSSAAPGTFRRRLILAAAVTVAAGTTLVAVHDVLPVLRRAARAVAYVQTETLPLNCLTERQATLLIRPYLRSLGSALPETPTSAHAMTVIGTRAELNAIRRVLGEFDGGTCRVQRAR